MFRRNKEKKLVKRQETTRLVEFGDSSIEFTSNDASSNLTIKLGEPCSIYSTSDWPRHMFYKTGAESKIKELLVNLRDSIDMLLEDTYDE